MTLTHQLKDYINAAFSGIWIETHEPDEAQRDILKLCEENQWGVAVWDIAQGFLNTNNGSGDPLCPLKTARSHTETTKTKLFLLHNYHRFLSNPVVAQELFNTIIQGKSERTFIVVLSPVVQIPIELEKVFVVLEHELPDETNLSGIATDLTEGKVINGLSASLHAARGLTRYEAEGAFALSLSRHNKLEPNVIWELKAQLLKKSGLLTLHRGKEKFDDLGGLESLKTFCYRAIGGLHAVRPRGVLLLGVPGTGKSAFAKALGNETGRPTLVLDVGSLMGGLVGQTESNVRNALRIADAMSPCVLFIDEVEKALAGVQGSGQGDSGVTARLFGTLLTWLNDHESDVFVVCTSNDVTKLPPEFSRAERFDGIFFLDLPDALERSCIWEMYEKLYQLGGNERPGSKVDDSSWTGAEIRSCCRLAALLQCSLQEASQYVVPVASTAADKVSDLREWAAGRCLSASVNGIYNPNPKNKNRRTVQNGKPNA